MQDWVRVFEGINIADLLSPLICSSRDDVIKLFDIHVTECESLFEKSNGFEYRSIFSNLKE